MFEYLFIVSHISIENTSSATPVPVAEGVAVPEATVQRAPVRRSASKGRQYSIQFRNVANDAPVNQNMNFTVEYHHRTGFNIKRSNDVLFHCSDTHEDVKKAYWALRFMCEDSIESFLNYARDHPNGLPNVFVNTAAGNSVDVLPLSVDTSVISEPH